MGQAAAFYGDVVITGQLGGMSALALPSGCVANDNVAIGAGIAASKCQRGPVVGHSQEGTATTKTVILTVIAGATATLKKVRVANVTACAGASTVTVDVQKNGVTVLTAVATLNAATGNLGVESPTINDPAAVVGDVITAVITINASGTDALATGVGVIVQLDEAYLV